MTVTADTIHDHIETDLDEYALERLIEDAYEAVAVRRGQRTGLTYRSDAVDAALLFLDPPADSVTTITEDEETLTADVDYALRYDGRAVLRIGRSWGETVIEYDASDDDPRQDRVVIDLVHLAIQYEALHSSGDGDYSETHLPYQAERERLLSELGGGSLGFR